MPTTIFISYHRDDATWQAREIFRALEQLLPHERVFMDIDGIPPGADRVEVLEERVDQCDILLALIGPGWLDAIAPKTGRRRSGNVQDFVRIEVRKGLARGIPVVPVLLDGTSIPDAGRLPDDLKSLVCRQAEFVDHRTVDADVERLIGNLGLGAPHRGAGAGGRVRPMRACATAIASATSPPPYPDDRNRPDGRIKIDARFIHGAPDGWFKPGAGMSEWFKDQDHGPEMVVAPAGSLMMGSPESEPGRGSDEGPQRKVTIARPFTVGRHSVTRGQFAAFVDATGHDAGGDWRNPGFTQDDSHPVVRIDWDDAQAYASWMARVSGRAYRLLSEAEREFVTRAGTTTPFWWGTSITPAQANYDGRYVYIGGGSTGEYRQRTVPVGSFAANPWGLFNVHGNTYDWCEDVWHDNYNGAPTDGSPWLQHGDANRRVVRGGSWRNGPRHLRAANRYRNTTGVRHVYIGFRLARTL